MSAPMVIQAVKLCRLLKSRCVITSNTLTDGSTANIHTSSALMAEPMKRRRKIDPAIVQAREQRKRRKIEKQIRRLERFSRKVKPIDEIVGDRKVLKSLDIRKRVQAEPSDDVIEQRVLLDKEWCRHSFLAHHRQMEVIGRAVRAQERAMAELKAESPELYDAAIQIDESLLPFKSKMPVLSPPNKDYEPPDGDYTDTTKTYE